MYVPYNPNPLGKSTGDCVIRALTVLLDRTWDEIYADLSVYGFQMKDWGSSNTVWNKYLFDLGYNMYPISGVCQICYTVSDFCENIARIDTKYLLSTGSHVVAVVGGNYYDSWDSGNEQPVFYYTKG